MSDLKITPTSNYAKLNCIHIDQLRTCTLSIYLSIYIYSVCVYIYRERGRHTVHVYNVWFQHATDSHPKRWSKNPTCVGWPSNSTKLNPLSCVYKNSPTRPGQSEPRVGQRIRWARWESPANSSLINFKWYSHLISILPRFTNLLQTLAVEAAVWTTELMAPITANNHCCLCCFVLS